MTISKRWLLVLLICLAQSASLLLGLASFTGWVERSASALMRRQVLEDNRLVAAQAGELIEQMRINDLRPEFADWARLQGVIERTKLPNDGFLCITDATSGQLLCHPELKRDPALQDMKPGLALLQCDRGGRRIIDASDTDSLSSQSGWAFISPPISSCAG